MKNVQITVHREFSQPIKVQYAYQDDSGIMHDRKGSVQSDSMVYVLTTIVQRLKEPCTIRIRTNWEELFLFLEKKNYLTQWMTQKDTMKPEKRRQLSQLLEAKASHQLAEVVLY